MDRRTDGGWGTIGEQFRLKLAGWGPSAEAFRLRPRTMTGDRRCTYWRTNVLVQVWLRYRVAGRRRHARSQSTEEMAGTPSRAGWGTMQTLCPRKARARPSCTTSSEYARRAGRRGSVRFGGRLALMRSPSQRDDSAPEARKTPGENPGPDGRRRRCCGAR